MNTAHSTDRIPNDLERHFTCLRSPYGCYIFSGALGIGLPSKEDCTNSFFLSSPILLADPWCLRAKQN